MSPTAFATILFWLLVGHALCDFPLQGEYLAACKRRAHRHGAGGMWVFGLSAHALIHAGAVALVTGSIGLGLCEFAAHWTIDCLKCEGKISTATDQALHFVCKLAWAAAAVAMVRP
jgi:hypothetical protein